MKKRKWMMFAGMLMAVTMLTACGSSYYESAAATEEIAMENTASYAADTGGVSIPSRQNTIWRPLKRE